MVMDASSGPTTPALRPAGQALLPALSRQHHCQRTGFNGLKAAYAWRDGLAGRVQGLQREAAAEVVIDRVLRFT